MKRILVCIIIGLGFTMSVIAQSQPVSANGVFRQEGIASWYGPGFEGRNTASGEIFDSSKFTAAHPTLPFGTILTVTNLQNNKQVIVRVNDRGPFTASRILDISKAAADQIEMIGPGTVPVLIESRGPLAVPPQPTTTPPVTTTPTASTTPTPAPATATPAPAYTPTPAPAATAPAYTPTPAPAAAAPAYTPAPAPVAATPPTTAARVRPALPPANSTRLYRIQVGAYRVMRNATETFERLKNAGLEPMYEHVGDIFRIVLTNVRADEVALMAEKIGAAGFQEILIREEL